MGKTSVSSRVEPCLSASCGSSRTARYRARDRTGRAVVRAGCDGRADADRGGASGARRHAQLLRRGPDRTSDGRSVGHGSAHQRHAGPAGLAIPISARQSRRASIRYRHRRDDRLDRRRAPGRHRGHDLARHRRDARGRPPAARPRRGTHPSRRLPAHRLRQPRGGSWAGFDASASDVRFARFFQSARLALRASRRRPHYEFERRVRASDARCVGRSRQARCRRADARRRQTGAGGYRGKICAVFSRAKRADSRSRRRCRRTRFAAFT